MLKFPLGKIPTGSILIIMSPLYPVSFSPLIKNVPLNAKFFITILSCIFVEKNDISLFDFFKLTTIESRFKSFTFTNSA